MTTMAHPVVTSIWDAVTAAMVGPLAEVQVLDAVDPARQAYAARSVTVGGTWDPELQGFATDGAIVVEPSERGAARRPLEMVSVQGIAYSGSGDTDFNVHRQNVGAVLVAVSAAVRAIRYVDGVNASMRLGAQEWAQGMDANGAFVLASFTVVASLLP